MLRRKSVLLVGSLAFWLCGCTTTRPQTVCSQAPDQPIAGVVFVADGSGDLHQVSDSLTAVALVNGVPLVVQRLSWSHGKGAIFPDIYDAGNQRHHGWLLAQSVLAYRQANPQQRICLVGYSSGASVVLAAADLLPPCTVDRMVLLSPCVAARHDLRPALRACREGLDTYHSEWDAICLVLFVLGTGDGAGKPIAGRSGFVPVIESPQDSLLYQGLRQHFWAGPECWAGHSGGHFGYYHPDFLRTQVLPVLLGR
jgi:pimeloyl-ACP methyl ester carboxylesterase